MLIRHRNFDDFADMANAFRGFDRLLGRFGDEGATATPWVPPVDIVETGNDLTLKADLPAVKPEDIEVKFEDGTLILRGKREFEKKEDASGYHRIERSYGSFVRAFTLPDTVDPEKVQAAYHDGVLTVTIGKKELAKPRSIKVNVAA